MEYETAGDPVTGLKWTRKTTEKIAEELRAVGIHVSPNTVGKLLKEMGFSLRVNHKKVSSGSPVDRDEQFGYIAELRERFARKGAPIVSVDTKKKELVGNFKNPGRAWARQPVLVNDHDFPSMAEGKAISYGIYDVLANRGSVFVGTSRETPGFTSDAIQRWWHYDGRRRYPQAKALLILADGGGGNGPRARAWKTGIQEKLCDRFGISVTVSHYPPGASKWNPIEHRLFSEISKNWSGRPLESYQAVLNSIRTTTTSKGLKVKAYLVRKEYEKGVEISEEEMKRIRIQRHETLPKWNYTLRPRKNGK